MKRTDALKAVQDAFADRIKRECDVLVSDMADAPASAKEKAKEAFTAGLSLLAEAETFARDAIEKTLPE